MIPQDTEVGLRYLVYELYCLIVFLDAPFCPAELLIGKEYRVDTNSRAVGEVVIRPMENRIILSLAYTDGFAAYITMLYDRTAQDMLQSGQRLRQRITLFKELP